MTEVFEREVKIRLISNWTDTGSGTIYNASIIFQTNDGLEITANNLDLSKEEFDKLSDCYKRDAKLTLRATLK